MNEYIRERLRNDARAVVDAARNEAQVPHLGLRGRFRELLVDKLLQPWLPPYVSLGTGMIVDSANSQRSSTQEDIVLFDSTIFPHVKLSPTGAEGLFPVDGVLMRIEVKSKLTRAELRSAVSAAADIYRLKFAAGNTYTGWGVASALFAFDTDLKGDSDGEFDRLLEVVREQNLHYSDPTTQIPGPISAICVVGRGCWTYGGSPARWHRSRSAKNYEEVLHFVGVMSNSCFAAHTLRQGGRLDRGANGGIGGYIISTETYEPYDRDPPRIVEDLVTHTRAPAWQALMKEAITAKSNSLGCPHCSGKIFHPGDDIVSAVHMTPEGRLDEYGPILPVAYAMCTQCGLILYFSATQLGLLWPHRVAL